MNKLTVGLRLLLSFLGYIITAPPQVEAFVFVPHTLNPLRTRKQSTFLSLSEQNHFDSDLVYRGPILPPLTDILSGLTLSELGLDLAIAPSTIDPSTGNLGLYVRLSQDVEHVTVPSMTLLCGYSRAGLFELEDVGDKTVGFALGSSRTAVFYERKLMSIVEALELAAGGERGCGLMGHELEQEEGGVGDIRVTAVNDGFPRYFVPTLEEEDDEENNLTVQNFGQYSNDLAWDYSNPPTSSEEYTQCSTLRNIVQLTWRLEYDPEFSCLKPSWPVSVLNQDVTFTNREDFMELGTMYGWKYWQATVDLDRL